MKTFWRNKYILTALLLCTVGALSFGLVKLRGANDAKEGDFVIVTSFYPIYIATLNLTENIDEVTVVNLTNNATGCIHDYQLSTKDLKVLDSANMLIMNGAGMEPFLDDVIWQQYYYLNVITVTDGISLLEGEEDSNPHSWMDISLYEQEVEIICDELIKADPENKQQYKDNYKKYSTKLLELADDLGAIREETEGVHVVTFHDAFIYLKNMCGFEVEESIDMDEETALSAAQVSEIVDLIKTGKVQYLITDESEGKAAAMAIADEVDVKVMFLNPLTSGEDDKDSYIDGMRENIDRIKEAFD